MKSIAFLLFVLLLSACAPMSKLPVIDQGLAAAERDKQLELAWRENVKRISRASGVGWPILAANADACGEKLRYRFGMGLGSVLDAPEGYRAVWRKVHGDHDMAVVLSADPGGPAQQAGLLPGDIVTALDGASLAGEAGRKKRAEILGRNTADPVKFELRRGDAPLAISIAPQQVCDFPIEVAMQDVVNAYADGKRIVITNGMMRFAHADDELALVIGHELAHNTNGHIKSKMGNRLLGAIFGAIVTVATGVDVTNVGADIGSMAYSQDFEAEADYVGTYYVAKAGYRTENAAEFWRRMAVEHPSAIGHGTSHPDTASRFVAINTAVKEIDGKRAAGAPLVPERKP